MKPSKQIEMYLTLNKRAEKHLDVLSSRLARKLGDESAHFFIQPSDGLCICFDDKSNALVRHCDVDALLSMSRSDAFNYLRSRTI